jgi:pimeloyl-ACP methyl ester carboxylesterase
MVAQGRPIRHGLQTMPSLLVCARIAEDVYHDRPTIVHGYEPVVVPRQEVYCSGGEFAGGAYAGSDGVGVIAFRGSREIEDWRGANLEIVRRKMPERQIGSALAFFAPAHRVLASAGCSRYIVVGHSLGGALAAVVAAAVTWVPVKGVTFNAPGLAQFVGSAQGAGFDLGQSNAGNVCNFRARDDVVSRWGRHIGQIQDIPSAGRHGISAFIACLDATRFGDMKF